MNKYPTILLICLIGTTAHILIKKGLNKIGRFEVHEIFSHFSVVLTNSHILLALLLYGIGIFIYFSLLSRTQLSTLYPIAVGIDFVLLALASYLLLGESFTVLKVSGLVLIFLGISCFYYSKA